MGGSGWSYFVPYQADVASALQQLRESVFQSGDYFQPSKFYRLLLERGTIDQRKYQELVSRGAGNAEPRTIQELVQVRGDQGTHSIIDITSVAPKGGLFTVSPLAPDEYNRIFGTDHPTHQIIEDNSTQLMTLRGPWQGVYVVAYRDGQPDEILFTGFSGD